MIEGKEAIADLIFQELEDIQKSALDDPTKAITRLYQTLNYLFNRVSAEEKIYFTTLFSRMVYVGIHFKIPRRELSLLHHFRKISYQQIYKNENRIHELDDQELIQLGLYSLSRVVEYLCNVSNPIVWMDWEQTKWDSLFKEPHFDKVIPACRVLVTQWAAAQHEMIGVSEEYPHHAVTIKYHVAGINDSHTDLLNQYLSISHLPVSLQLIDIEVDDQKAWSPHMLVLEPDYLVDVTAIAECFKDFGVLTWSYLLNKFKSKPSGPSLLLGNAANYFLDELMVNPNAPFNDLMRQFFKIYPLECTVLEDKEVIDLNVKAKNHYTNLKKVITEDFKQMGIISDGVYLEPTFISAVYGLQGRLDLFHEIPSRKLAHIVELKSSKPYKTNAYGINANNYIQTLLYDLLIRSVFNNQFRLASYILYSQQDQKSLRFAPPIKAQQAEALATRNEIVLMEHRLTQTDKLEEMMSNLSPSLLPSNQGFIANDLQEFQKVYSGLSPLLKSYLIQFSGFIAREHHLAKVGEHSDESNNGLASLWLNNRLEKEENFNILSHLVYDGSAEEEADFLIFNKSKHSNELSNFRQGDIGVLYPYSQSGVSALEHQIFKCSIVEIGSERVVLRLRNKQRRKDIFANMPFWNLEHDLIDSSFNSLYRSLFDFMTADDRKQKLLLSLEAPLRPLAIEIKTVPTDLNEEQIKIFKEIISTQDYYLLWGPPGTGKTSIMLRSIAQYIFNSTEQSILLIAYTNRAVDEICEALASVNLDFLRIGSRLTAMKKFWPNFLDEQANGIERRSEFKTLVLSQRIIVGTLSSISGKSELFQLRSFDWVIVDEASQILEPNLMGLLPRVSKWVLIGDHKQMPAVVVQHANDSIIQDELLKDMGLTNLRNSLFERLLNQCKKNEWTWSFNILREQGRMHKVIMEFPSKHFYNGELTILRESNKASLQEVPLNYALTYNQNALMQAIAHSRMLYLPTPIDKLNKSKINKYEANLAVDCVQTIYDLYAMNGLKMQYQTIGIITPFRAQIAQIRKVLQDRNMDPDSLSIDTVERYQGGARDIIILSLCTNRFSQMQNMVSLSDEGIDRKLNVALTRARQHMIILGNEEILNSYPVYKELIDYCRKNSLPNILN